MVKKSHIKQVLLIASGFCHGHYQVLLIILLKDFTMINAHIVSLVLNTYQPKIWVTNINPIVHGGSEAALKHGGGGEFTPSPLAKIQTTKAVDLKLGTLIK